MNLINTVGTFAGIVALLGVAVLAMLFFSQARDVRRMKEGTDVDEQRATTATHEAGYQPLPVVPPLPVATGAHPHLVRRREDVPVDDEKQSRVPRAIAMAAIGIVVAAGGTLGVVLAVGGGGSGSTKAKEKRARPKPVAPASVVVTVLNGTGVAGLAKNVGEELKGDGFRLAEVTNAAEQDFSTTQVFFAPGGKRKAQLVADKLDTRSPNPEDSAMASLGAGADVVVVVGSDRSTGATAPAAPASPVGVPTQ